MADYGNGETATQETTVSLATKVVKDPSGSYTVDPEPDIFKLKPSEIVKEGTINGTFTYLKDQCLDYKITALSSLVITVDSVIDYRKLGTSLSLLNRPQLWSINIDQTVTIQAQEQFVRLEYQGDTRGFQSFFNTLNSLLNSPSAQANLSLTLTIDFTQPITPDGTELNLILQTLQRNPVERLNLKASVSEQ